MENMTNRINAKLVNNKKDYLKCNIKNKLYVVPNIWQ